MPGLPEPVLLPGCWDKGATEAPGWTAGLPYVPDASATFSDGTACYYGTVEQLHPVKVSHHAVHECFALGFGLVIFTFTVSWGLGSVISMIRRA